MWVEQTHGQESQTERKEERRNETEGQRSPLPADAKQESHAATYTPPLTMLGSTHLSLLSLNDFCQLMRKNMNTNEIPTKVCMEGQLTQCLQLRT